jgi:hypothetical protein
MRVLLVGDVRQHVSVEAGDFCVSLKHTVNSVAARSKGFIDRFQTIVLP